MSDWEIWLTIACLVAATALTRSAFWMVGKHIQLPSRVQEALRYAPACALAAIVAPDLLLGDGHLHVDWTNHRLIAGVAAIAFYMVKRDMLLTILLGMLLLTGLRLMAA
jgi:branched-subunit amino acid transport protein